MGKVVRISSMLDRVSGEEIEAALVKERERAAQRDLESSKMYLPPTGIQMWTSPTPILSERERLEQEKRRQQEEWKHNVEQGSKWNPRRSGWL